MSFNLLFFSHDFHKIENFQIFLTWTEKDLSL
jgi:hypothetical protein